MFLYKKFSILLNSNPCSPMDDIRKAIGKKYQRGIDELITKYINQFDDELDVIDILKSEEEETFLIDEISFIKSTKATDKIVNSKIFIFNDVYKMLCTDCDFEDICSLLS